MEVFVGWKDQQQHNTYKRKIEVGDVITVKYSGINQSGILSHPVFLSPRVDINWEDLIKEFL